MCVFTSMSIPIHTFIFMLFTCVGGFGSFLCSFIPLVFYMPAKPSQAMPSRRFFWGFVRWSWGWKGLLLYHTRNADDLHSEWVCVRISVGEIEWKNRSCHRRVVRKGINLRKYVLTVLGLSMLVCWLRLSVCMRSNVVIFHDNFRTVLIQFYLRRWKLKEIFHFSAKNTPCAKIDERKMEIFEWGNNQPLTSLLIMVFHRDISSII